jgi:Uma2 family endonuclease
MNLALPEIDQPVRLHFDCPMTDEELLRFCAENESLRIERDANGEIIVMTPPGLDGGGTELDVAAPVGGFVLELGKVWG